MRSKKPPPPVDRLIYLTRPEKIFIGICIAGIILVALAFAVAVIVFTAR